MRIALPTLFRRDVSEPAPLPPWAPMLWRLAHFALGDDRSATALMIEVLQQAPITEGEAVRQVATRLPEGWLSWPGAASPGEWLRLRLRREQTDRLLSVLGEWSARERLALGLYLLWDVPRDQLDHWLGTRGMAQSVAELIAHVGDSLDWVDPPSDDPACVPYRADLLEAHEPAAPPDVRRHLLGCAACRAYAGQLRRTKDLVRLAMDVFFRQPPPVAQLAQVAVRPRVRPRRHVAWGPLLVPLLVALLAAAAVIVRPHRAPTTVTAQAPALSAADVLKRALDRFAQAPPGILHEQARAGSGPDAVLIDRWFDRYGRVRITARSAATNQSLVDVSSDGTHAVSYRITLRDNGTTEAVFDAPNLKTVLPMLRQLPFVGSFGALPVPQDMLDIPLLAQAQRGTPALLGTRQWQNRSGYLINSTQTDGSRLVLLIDGEQWSLLQAQRIVPNATPQTLWQAQTVETPPSAPADTWAIVSTHKVTQRLNPRHLLDLSAPVNLGDVTASLNIPVPLAVPNDVVTHDLHALDEPNYGVLQLYESQWSTMAIVTARPRYTFRPPSDLPRAFTHGHYAVLDNTVPQATFVIFAHDDDPNQRSAVYLWDALASPEERERKIEHLLNSIELANHTNAAQYASRFTATP